MLKSILITLLILLSFGVTFAAGYILASTGLNVAPVEPGKGEPLVTFEKGRLFFDDTAIVITDSQPRLVLVATNVRSESATGTTQNTRVSFFNGSKWERKTLTQPVSNVDIASNALVREWGLRLDPSRVLKEHIDGKVTFGNSNILFTAQNLQNEMTLRSTPGYTKFISEAPAQLTVDGISHKARILYTKIYSLNAKEIQFYDQPLGITTDWVIFWDTNGNFYHVDKTELEKPTDVYKAHEIAVVKDTTGKIMKTFDVATNRDATTPPINYTIKLGTPISATMQFKNINSFEKTTGWFLGLVEGDVLTQSGEKVSGFGLVEYIHD